MHKIGQSGGFLGITFSTLLKTGLPLIGNVLKSFSNAVLIPLKMFGSSVTTLITSNEEMNGIRKIVKTLEEFGLLTKRR